MGGGDSNVAFDQGLDKTKPLKAQLTRPTKMSQKIAKLLYAQGWADAWRELNPSRQDFTHYSYPYNTYARIVHILVPLSLLPIVLRTQFRDTALLDHSIVVMSSRSVTHDTKRGHWRLNESILSDPIRATEINKALQEYFQLNKVEGISAETLGCP